MINLSSEMGYASCMQGMPVKSLHFVPCGDTDYISVYAQYGSCKDWLPLQIGMKSMPTLQQVRDMDRNISLSSGSYENAHFYLRSADGNNVTTAFYTSREGGAIQSGDTAGYVPLNLQPMGGLLRYGGDEVATKAWSAAQGYLKLETDPVYSAAVPDILMYRTLLPDGSNLNSYTTTGIYLQNSSVFAAAGANYPVALAGKLEVVNQGRSFVWQTYHVYGDTTAANRGIWRREYYGVWTAWTKMVDTVSASSYISQNGNSFGSNISIGTNDNYNLYFRQNGTDKAYLNNSGILGATGIQNYASAANGLVTFDATGTILSRNVADANAVLRVNNLNATSTGSIQEWYANGVQVAVVNKIGRIGLGTGALGQATFHNSLPITGNVNSIGILLDGQIQSDAATSASMVTTAPSTQAATFTLGQLLHYNTLQGTFGNGSTVSVQVGFNAAASLIGASNNYGFRGQLPSGSGRWNLYMDGSANNYLASRLGIGTMALSNSIVHIATPVTGATTMYTHLMESRASADVTGSIYGYVTSLGTIESAFNLGNMIHYHAQQGVIGEGSAITNQTGFNVSANMISATNSNYAFRGQLPAAAGANRWNLYMDGTAGNYLGGRLGMGAANLSVTTFRNTVNVSGAATAYANYTDGIIQPDVTSVASYNTTVAQTQAAAFTLNSLRHYQATQSTIGAGSSVVEQMGFYVSSNLTGATTNYAFRSQIAAGANRWNLYMDGTANNYLGGRIGLGTLSLNGFNIGNALSITGNTSAWSNYTFGVVQSDVTAAAIYNQTLAQTQAATFTINAIKHYSANQGVFGAGSTVSTQSGFHAESTLVGANTNWGFRGAIPYGTGNWNLYMDGAANNHLAGALSIGTTIPTVLHASATLLPGMNPKMEVLSGTGAGIYREGIVIRHGNNDATSVTRETGLIIKLSGEGTTAEASKGGAITMASGNAFANSPDMNFYIGTDAVPKMKILNAGNVRFSSIAGTGNRFVYADSNGTLVANISTIPVASGGTGAISLTGIVTGNGSNALTAITGAAGQLLRRNASDTGYEFFDANFLAAVPSLQQVAAAGNTFTGDLVLGQAGNAVYIGSGPAGSGNTRMGNGALQSNVNGNWNVAIGSSSQASLQTSDNNTTVGEYTMPDYTGIGGGGNNTAIGNSAGQGMTTGRDNTLLGAACGYTGGSLRSRGDRNTFVGAGAGNATNIAAGTTPLGSGNIFIGFNAGGGPADSLLSRQLRIGHKESLTDLHLIEGDMTQGAQHLKFNASLQSTELAGAGLLKADAGGNLVSAQAGVDYVAPGAGDFESGIYTPSINMSGNPGSAVCNGFTFIRVGGVVHVSGVISCSGLTPKTGYSMIIDLPIPSMISTIYDVVGHVTGVADPAGNTVSGYVGPNAASVFIRTTGSSEIAFVSFQYQLQ